MDDWQSWSNFILAELKRLSSVQDKIAEKQEKIGDKMEAISSEISALKVKATIWGAVGASVPILLFVAIQILVKFATTK